MTDYRCYDSDKVRDIQADILDQEPKYINVCGCPLNHVILSWRRIDSDYIFAEACETEVSATYTLEEFMALNKKDTYCYPWSDDVRDLRTDMEWAKNVEVCSCPKKHTYTYIGDKSTRVPGFACGTPVSWSGSLAKLLDNKIEVKPVEDAKTLILTPKEEALVRYARSTYEAPPDKNIIAAIMMTQWIRAQRMPFESDRLIELYDAPKKKGIV
jgi:hypothetical protein